MDSAMDSGMTLEWTPQPTLEGPWNGSGSGMDLGLIVKNKNIWDIWSQNNSKSAISFFASTRTLPFRSDC